MPILPIIIQADKALHLELEVKEEAKQIRTLISDPSKDFWIEIGNGASINSWNEKAIAWNTLNWQVKWENQSRIAIHYFSVDPEKEATVHGKGLKVEGKPGEKCQIRLGRPFPPDGLELIVTMDIPGTPGIEGEARFVMHGKESPLFEFFLDFGSKHIKTHIREEADGSWRPFDLSQNIQELCWGMELDELPSRPTFFQATPTAGMLENQWFLMKYGGMASLQDPPANPQPFLKVDKNALFFKGHHGLLSLLSPENTVGFFERRVACPPLPISLLDDTLDARIRFLAAEDNPDPGGNTDSSFRRLRFVLFRIGMNQVFQVLTRWILKRIAPGEQPLINLYIGIPDVIAARFPNLINSLHKDAKDIFREARFKGVEWQVAAPAAWLSARLPENQTSLVLDLGHHFSSFRIMSGGSGPTIQQFATEWQDGFGGLNWTFNETALACFGLESEEKREKFYQEEIRTAPEEYLQKLKTCLEKLQQGFFAPGRRSDVISGHQGQKDLVGYLSWLESLVGEGKTLPDRYGWIKKYILDTLGRAIRQIGTFDLTIIDTLYITGGIFGNQTIRDWFEQMVRDAGIKQIPIQYLNPSPGPYSMLQVVKARPSIWQRRGARDKRNPFYTACFPFFQEGSGEHVQPLSLKKAVLKDIEEDLSDASKKEHIDQRRNEWFAQSLNKALDIMLDDPFQRMEDPAPADYYTGKPAPEKETLPFDVWELLEGKPIKESIMKEAQEKAAEVSNESEEWALPVIDQIEKDLSKLPDPIEFLY